MSARVANESEHRRGLVLGFTLAEVLILLLFLVLLAFGARLAKVQSALEKIPPFWSELSKTDALAGFDAQTLVAELARAKTSGAVNSDLHDENLRLRLALAETTQKLQSLEKVMAAASEINPDDPPALLKFVPNLFNVVGVKVDRDLWDRLSEMTSRIYEAEKTMTATEREKFRRSLAALVAKDVTSSSGHRWPPIIRLSEADGYYFQLGRAELGVEFSKKLRGVIPQLLATASDYQVDVIEVVGHTDELAIASRPSNLDKDLLAVLRGEKELKSLIPADNAGLGLTRALAVVELLRKDSRLSNFRILALSGAQLVQTDETLSDGTRTGNVKERRRIEIRLRKRN